MQEHKETTVDVQHFLNDHPFSKLQWMIFTLCFLVALFDGFDTAAIGYIAPSLIDEWGIQKNDLAPVLSAALLGLAIGAIFLGPVADKVGRKKILIISVIIFALGSLASAKATSLFQLEILRFITGIGLGAAMPNAVTLLSEYCPENRRYLLVNTMFCAFPVGAALGGFIAAWMIPNFGWRSVLWLGGVAPLILVGFMLFLLPESVRHLVRKKVPIDTIKAILINISKTAQNATSFILTEHQQVSDGTKTGIAIVLSRHYLLGSIMLWIAYFMGLMIFYGVMNWMPLLFSEANLSGKLGSIVTGLFALGGLGAIANGWLMARYNPNKLIAGLSIMTFILVGLIGIVASINVTLLVVTVILAGIVMNTAQASLPSFAASFYPTAGRTTGVSWMLGLGRFGGIAGSFLVAQLLFWQLDLNSIFFILAIPSLITALVLSVMYFGYKDR